MNETMLYANGWHVQIITEDDEVTTVTVGRGLDPLHLTTISAEGEVTVGVYNHTRADDPDEWVPIYVGAVREDDE